MRHLITILFLLFLVLFPSCKNIRERGLFGKKAKTLEMLKAEQTRIRVADSLKRIENRLKAIEEARLDSLRMAAEEEQAAFEAINKFNIVVGSFITPEYAQAWAEEYRKQGYDTRIIKMTGSRFELVVAESYDRFSKAVERLNEFQTTVDIDSWLYVHKQ
jgi:predicted Holliday junction resolvase-like endonuclease